jgi:hypothetical protein
MAYEIFIKSQIRSNPEIAEVYQKIYERAGWNGVKRKFLEAVKPGEQKYLGENYMIAILSANLGDKEQAFEYLNRSFERREWRILLLNIDPPLDSLRDDPRFDELVRRVGLK